MPRMDYLGNEINVNDLVLYAVKGGSGSGDMKLGLVINITDKVVVIREFKKHWWAWSSGISRVLNDSNIVKYDGPVPDGWFTAATAAQ